MLHGASLDDNIELGTVDMKVVEEMPFLTQVRTARHVTILGKSGEGTKKNSFLPQANAKHPLLQYHYRELAPHNFSLDQASATVSPRTASCPGTMQIFVKTRESRCQQYRSMKMY